jgi:hypothetical protein
LYTLLQTVTYHQKVLVLILVLLFQSGQDLIPLDGHPETLQDILLEVLL